MLNSKQHRFVEEYLIDLNATQAAIRAGYSAGTAYSQGQRLLKHVEVAARLREAQGEMAERARLTAEMIVAELRKIGFSDIRRLFTEEGSLRRVESLDDEAAASLSSVEVVTRRVAGSDRDEPEYEHVAKIKLWDKRAALVDLGKHLGMFTDKLEHSGGVNVTINKPGGA